MVRSVQPGNNDAVNPNNPNDDSSSDNSTDSFQSYLNADPSTVVNSSNVPTPYQLMSSPNSPNFGAPPSDTGPLDPAPENFGPPQIGNNSSPSSNFGPPTAAKNNSNPIANNPKASPNQKLTPQKATPPQTPVIPAKPTQSYQKVRTMETNAMMQNAIAHMKVKDPDPGAWQ